MPGVEVNDFTAPDEVRRPERTTVEIVKIADGEVGRYTFQPGWRWSECIKPIVGTDSCQVEHVGYVVSGSMHVEHADGQVFGVVVLTESRVPAIDQPGAEALMAQVARTLRDRLRHRLQSKPSPPRASRHRRAPRRAR